MRGTEAAGCDGRSVGSRGEGGREEAVPFGQEGDGKGEAEEGEAAQDFPLAPPIQSVWVLTFYARPLDYPATTPTRDAFDIPQLIPPPARSSALVQLC